MEAEHGIARDTDVVSRNDAGQECAGRQAGAIDHNMLSAVADFMELANVGGDLAARIADNANVGRGYCRCNNGGRCEAHSSQRERASKGSLPFHWSHPLSLLSPLCCASIMARVRVYGKLIRMVRCGFSSQQLPQVPSPAMAML